MDNPQFIVHCTDHLWTCDGSSVEHFAIKQNGSLEVKYNHGARDVYAPGYWLRIEDQKGT